MWSQSVGGCGCVQWKLVGSMKRKGKEDRRCLDEDIRANLRWENNS